MASLIKICEFEIENSLVPRELAIKISNILIFLIKKRKIKTQKFHIFSYSEYILQIDCMNNVNQ